MMLRNINIFKASCCEVCVYTKITSLCSNYIFQSYNRLYFTKGGTTSNHVTARSEFECTVMRSKCNEGCDWFIYVTAVTCADTTTFTLCIQTILLPQELLH